MAQSRSPPAVRNRLLAALPPENLAQLLPKLHPVSLPLRKALLAPQERIEAVYFIESGWASVVAQLNDGTQAEIGLIGREGMVGLSLIVRPTATLSPSPVPRAGSIQRLKCGSWRGGWNASMRTPLPITGVVNQKPPLAHHLAAPYFPLARRPEERTTSTC
jgi:hypothetical protein